MKFYHYVHCPFCVRVRMAFGFLKLNYKSIVVPYNNEELPIKLTGKKMLPILEYGDSAMNESLDIIKQIDSENLIDFALYEQNSQDIEDLLSEIGSSVHSMAMPYWIWTKEFDEDSRKYFQDKKEIKRGPFKDLVKKVDQFSSQLNVTLEKLDHNILKDAFYKSDVLTIADIMIASHLWGMYIVPEYQFPNAIHHYLQRVKKACHFNYHEDFWR